VTNDYYDQVKGISEPVRPSWIKGTAEYRIPYLGWVRLTVSGTASMDPVAPAAANATAPQSGAFAGAPVLVQRVDDNRESDSRQRALGQHRERLVDDEQLVDDPASSEPRVTNPNPMASDRSAGEPVRFHAFSAKYVTAPPSSSVTVFSATTMV